MKGPLLALEASLDGEKLVVEGAGGVQVGEGVKPDERADDNTDRVHS